MIQPSSEWTKRRTSRPRLLEVEHQIADALARAVIGVAAAAAGLVDREAERIEQLGRVGAGAGGEQGRMLEQPDAFARRAGADRRGALLHEGERLRVRHERVADPPLDVVGSSTSRDGAARLRGKRDCNSGSPARITSAATTVRGNTSGRNCRFRRAWDETREVLAARRQPAVDGRAGAVRLCPRRVRTSSTPAAKPGELPPAGPWLIVLLIAVLDLRSSASSRSSAWRSARRRRVGEAIGHGAQRLLPYFVAIADLGRARSLLSSLLCCGAADAAADAQRRYGGPLPRHADPADRSGGPADHRGRPSRARSRSGPLGILKRSWQLTAAIGGGCSASSCCSSSPSFCVMVAVGAIIGILAGIVLGPPEPMTVSALVIALITQLAVARRHGRVRW